MPIAVSPRPSPSDADFDVIAVDFRGHGRSPGRRGVVRTYDELTEDLLNVLEWASNQVRGVQSLRARALERRTGRAAGGPRDPGQILGPGAVESGASGVGRRCRPPS